MSMATDEDGVMERLRAARPELPHDEADPRSPRNVALLGRVLTEPAARREAVARRRLIRGRLGGRAVAAVAAAAAVAVVAATAAVLPAGPFKGVEPAAAVVRAASEASPPALQTARARLVVTVDGVEDTYDYTLAGDDVDVVMTLRRGLGEAYEARRRVVAGETYWALSHDPAGPWFHAVGDAEGQAPLAGEPRALLAALEPSAGFEVVGDEELDGVAVTHLRATTPEGVDPAELRLAEATMTVGSVTALDVWVDGDDVVRGIDLTMAPPFTGAVFLDGPTGEGGAADGSHDGPVEVTPDEVTEAEPAEVTASVRFSGLGDPVSVGAPTEYEDVDLATATVTEG